MAHGRSLRALVHVAAASALALACLVADRSPVARAQSSAQSAQTDLTTKARQAILMDAESGAILYQLRADDLVPPASMSKLMTLAVVFKALKAGQIKLDDEYLISVNAWRRGGAPSGTSAMMIPVNTKEKLDQLLNGIIVQSGNDAAIAIAEGMAGNEDAFGRMLTEEARKLGLKKSVFKNATGLHDPEHLVTVRELAMLTRHLIREYPDHYQRFALKEFKYRTHRFTNRNPILGSVGTDGLKTGFTKEAGYGLVASAKQDNRRLILVINGLERQEDRRNEAIRMLEWGFKIFTEHKLYDAEQIVGHARVWGGRRMYVPLTGKGDVNIVMSRFPANQKLKAEIVYNGPLKTPVNKGDPVAILRVTSSTQSVNEVPLYAAEDVESAGVLKRGFDSLLHMTLRWLL
jgi:serine-type D-Ala-D-Ala carboxypeptidase (penicillin-binding protein 5/6)